MDKINDGYTTLQCCHGMWQSSWTAITASLKRLLPASLARKTSVGAAEVRRRVIEVCEAGVEVLTLFAFSSEN
jgi:undecaprenyl pyrophosphate synthase